MFSVCNRVGVPLLIQRARPGVGIRVRVRVGLCVYQCVCAQLRGPLPLFGGTLFFTWDSRVPLCVSE